MPFVALPFGFEVILEEPTHIPNNIIKKLRVFFNAKDHLKQLYGFAFAGPSNF